MKCVKIDLNPPENLKSKLAVAVSKEVWAKPLSYECECPVVMVSTKGITADHENWIQQHSKPGSSV